jgi:hypothetical protein
VGSLSASPLGRWFNAPKTAKKLDCGHPLLLSFCRHTSSFIFRASPAVEGPQTEIRRYLAPDG